MKTEVTRIARSAIGSQINIHHAYRALPASVLAEVRDLEAEIEAILSDIQTIKSSPDFTPQGVRKELEIRWRKALTLLRPFEERVMRYDARTQEEIEKALSQHRPPAKDVVDVLLQQEIRATLRGKDPLEVEPIYINAIEGDSQLLVRAIEDAPIPMLTSDARKRGAEMRLERLGKAGVVAELKEDRAFWTVIIGAAKGEVAEAVNMAVDGLDDPIAKQIA